MNNNLHKVLIAKHKWVQTSDNWGEYCIYCNSRIGIGTGTDGVTFCNDRFDREKFNNWLQFRNYSKVNSTSKITKYQKRYTDEKPISENDLLKRYLVMTGLSVNLLKTVKEYDQLNK